MKTGFVIVNYNDSKTTKELLDNIINYNIIDKIIVVDNASTDNSYEELSKINNSKLSVIRSKENKGYGSGINIGCKYLREIFDDCNIIISNSDIIIKKEEDLKKLIDNLSNDDIGAVAPIINEHGSLNRGWKIPNPMQDVLLNIPYFYQFLRPKLLLYKDDYYDNLVDVEVVSGCFFLIKLSTLEKINYFDENIFLYYEENILAHKLKKINKKTIINNNIEVIHNHSVTIDKNINRVRKYKALKKSQMYFHKVYNKANVFERVLLAITIKLGLLVQYIISI